jgi:hypothetical protein
LSVFGRHEEVKQRNQRFADGCQEGLFLKPFAPVIALTIHELRHRFFVRRIMKRLPFFLRSLERVKLVPMKFQNREGTEFLMSERDGNVPVGDLLRSE